MERKRGLDASEVVAAFFESPDGLAFLHRLVLVLHLVLCYRPAGIRGVCEALELSGLSRFVAASYGAQQAVSVQLQEQLVGFGRQQRAAAQAAQAAQGPQRRRISLTEDETFHPQICLVAIEPVSDFIVLEGYAEARDAKTWNEQLKEALAGLNVQVVQSTSDEAKGILSHVREGLSAHHSPDLFHLQQALARGVFPGLCRARRGAQERQQAAAKTTAFWQGMVEASERPGCRRRGRPPNHRCHLNAAQQAENQATAAVEQLQSDYQQAKTALRALSDTYHPYDLGSGAPLDPEQGEKALHQHLDTVERISAQHHLGAQAQAGIDKARRLLPALRATLSFFFTFVQARVAELALPLAIEQAMHQALIPALYLQAAAAKAPTAEQRKAITATSERLLQPLRSPQGPLARLDDAQKAQLEQVAHECANLFQRSSSCVEGRNGYLALWHHNLHALSARRLQALTVMHNYYTRRPDAITPARPARKRPPPPPPQPLLAAA